MTRIQLPVIAEVEGLGKVVEAIGDFYSELKQLKKDGSRLISPRDEAYARLQTRGKENIGRTYGARTSGGFESAKYQLPIFRVSSRLTDTELAKLAVEANRNREYYHTETTREYEESLVQAEKEKDWSPEDKTTIILPSRNSFTMSDKENWEIYEAILKDQAKPYFELNGPITICPVNKKVVDAQNGTLLTQLWFRSLDGKSDFVGYSGSLDGGYRARGIRVAEGDARNLGRKK